MLPNSIQVIASLISLLATSASSTSGQYDPQPIIVDTDIFSDVDDVGSLAVANVLHNWGLADLRGIAINTHSKYGALAASVSPSTRLVRVAFALFI